MKKTSSNSTPANGTSNPSSLVKFIDDAEKIGETIESVSSKAKKVDDTV